MEMVKLAAVRLGWVVPAVGRCGVVSGFAFEKRASTGIKDSWAETP